MLAKVVQACRAYGAKLVIAKLDRLSRDANFLLGLEKAGVDFVAADMPNANRLPVGIMAMVAEEERRMISKRTKDALVAAKRRGTQLGGDRGVVPSKKARAMGVEAPRARADAGGREKTSLRAIAAGLNDAGDRIGADVELHARLLDRHNFPRPDQPLAMEEDVGTSRRPAKLR
jgi:DNA invertase Pin-like site-specific DNA recombinase